MAKAVRRLIRSEMKNCFRSDAHSIAVMFSFRLRIVCRSSPWAGTAKTLELDVIRNNVLLVVSD